ncbi:MAG TPA: ABC transporter ATP-binding protein [Chloroflexota bacterium]|nr:ABC transporter ATP-binding protein [Chloroflexota bacterium]
MLSVNVRKRLRDVVVTVDVALDDGVTALVGPSGAGKSTLLRLIAGLTHPDSGTIRLGEVLLDDAEHHYHLPPGRRGIGLVFQEYALFPHLSVAENVAYGLRARGLPGRERRTRVTEMLERLGIAALAGERPERLSGGQRQRVALARALVLQPSALLLDEPLAALDVQTRAGVRHELRLLLSDLAIPTILVTHDYTDALAFRRRILIMDAGHIVQDGSHDTLLTHPGSRFVAEFTGVNYYEGTLEAHDPDRTGRVRLAGGVDVYAAADDVPPGPVGLALRPWEVTVSPRPPAGSARNVLPGRVREVLPMGGRVRLILDVGPRHSLPLVAEITPRAQDSLGCREGQTLYASFKATALALIPL